MADDNNIQLSRRKVLAGLGTIGVASAGAGLGTTAWLSDEESFLNNVLTAGTLDLVVDYEYSVDQGSAGTLSGSGVNNGGEGESPGGDPISFTIDDVKPGDSGNFEFCFSIYDNPAYLWACGGITATLENGYTEPEPVDENGEGELDDAIQATAYYCDGDGTNLGEIASGTLSDVVGLLNSGVPLDSDPSTEAVDPFAPGDETDNPCVCIDWSIDGPSVGNEIQGDSLSFDVTFHAVQSRHNEENANPCATDTECEPCELPTGPALSDDVQISSVDASAFPDVSVFLRVDTTAGNDGDLTAADFEVCEGGLAQDESVSFTSGSAADIVFVFDDTGSMGDEIIGAKNAINNFVTDITGAGIDARFALVSFKDNVELDQDFTSDQSTISSAINGLSASGGGDFRENNFDALGVATRDIAADTGGMLSAYRAGAQKVVIDITDAAAQVDNTVSSYTMSDIEALLAGYTYIAVSPDDLNATYADGDKQVLANNVGGTHFVLPESSSDEFSDLLTDEVGGLLTTTYTVTYTSCNDSAEPAERDLLIQVDDPDEGTLYQETSYTVPSP